MKKKQSYAFLTKSKINPFEIAGNFPKEDFSQDLSPGTKVIWNMKKLVIAKVDVSNSFRVDKFLWFKQKITPTTQVSITLKGDPDFPKDTLRNSIFRLSMDEFIQQLHKRTLYINKLESVINQKEET